MFFKRALSVIANNNWRWKQITALPECIQVEIPSLLHEAGLVAVRDIDKYIEKKIS